MATLVRLDTGATSAAPGASAPSIPSGYDPVFREPVKLPDLTDPTQPTTADARRYLEPIQIQAQHEPLSFDEEKAMYAAGKSPDVFVRLVFHYRDLESMGLVNERGEPMIRLDDRLTKICRMNGELVRRFREPGFFATQVQDDGLGIGTHRNLLIVDFEDRKTAQ